MGLRGARAKAAGIDGDRLFRAGVSYLHSHAYALAYSCFDRLADDDWQVAYNKALCCFGVGDYERCYTILCAVESLLPVPQSPDFAELPDTLLRWEHESPMPICPLCFETFTPEVTVLFFRLKAEAAFRLRRYDEVKVLAARLGGRYRHICKLIEQIDHDSQRHL